MSEREKLSLNLNEENELGFKVSIEGSSKDIGNSSPNIRFVLSEGDSKQGWIYPASFGQGTDREYVTVNIPAKEDLFSEERTYQGKLEVILENHYFVPIEVDIDFEKPLKVEGAVVNKGSKMVDTDSTKDAPQVKATASTVTQKKKPQQKAKPLSESKPEPQPPKQKRKRTWNDLTPKEKEYVKKKFKQKKLAEAKRKKQLADKKQAQLKSQLKSLMGDSLLEE